MVDHGLNGHPNKIPTDKILGGVVQNCRNIGIQETWKIDPFTVRQATRVGNRSDKSFEGGLSPSEVCKQANQAPGDTPPKSKTANYFFSHSY